MRKLTRLRTDTIPSSFHGQKRIEKTLKQLKVEQARRCEEGPDHKFPSNWSECKINLHQETEGKCAYCEAPTMVASYGDVEHYRPKSKYWWLAYCYDNYVASCTLCNRAYKDTHFEYEGTQWPAPEVPCEATEAELKALAPLVTPDAVDDEAGMSYARYRELHFQQRPYILNPYFDDPADYFAWEVDHAEEVVELVVKEDENPLHRRVVEAAEVHLGLNRKELKERRYEAYLSYAKARVISEAESVPEEYRAMQRDTVTRLLRPETPFVGMLQYWHQKSLAELPMPV